MAYVGEKCEARLNGDACQIWATGSVRLNDTETVRCCDPCGDELWKLRG